MYETDTRNIQNIQAWAQKKSKEKPLYGVFFWLPLSMQINAARFDFVDLQVYLISWTVQHASSAPSYVTGSQIRNTACKKKKKQQAVGAFFFSVWPEYLKFPRGREKLKGKMLLALESANEKASPGSAAHFS